MSPIDPPAGARGARRTGQVNLELTGSFGAVAISPKDRQAFLAELRSAAPHVAIEGDLHG